MFFFIVDEEACVINETKEKTDFVNKTRFNLFVVKKVIQFLIKLTNFILLQTEYPMSMIM